MKDPIDMQDLKRYPIRFSTFLAACAVALGSLATTLPVYGQAHVVEILADKDSHFKVPGQTKPQITIKAGEQVVLRIDARKSKTWSREGTVHGFTMLRMKDRARVANWDFELKPGMNEFTVTAPAEPGEYEVLCTVICSGDHEGMRMKVVVLP
jgi:heme/copper-type cytochrome/quinol oxidase subunit 2